MLQRTELDERVGLADQLAEEVGPVILVNTFKVAPEDVDELLQAWAADAALLRSRPGFISTQLHRGIAGSSVFLNTAVWESVQAFATPLAIQRSRPRSPGTRTPRWRHRILFQKVAVPGICVDR
jgi:quinol monooxygenase YgiN